MHTIRVYVDTSVFGGVCDEEFASLSRRFFERAARGEFIVLVSRLTADELEHAPEDVIRVLRKLPPEAIEAVVLDEQVRELADQYIRAGVLPQRWGDDATHVAAATVAGADLVLSWNFRHIVNYHHICGFNSVNTRNGYRTMMILSPREVIDESEEQDV